VNVIKVLVCPVCGEEFKNQKALKEIGESCCTENAEWHFADEDADGGRIFVNSENHKKTYLDPNSETLVRR
jgi:hypothetical protein